jgi:hypothetical protein
LVQVHGQFRLLSTPTITRLTMPSMLRRRGGGLSHVNIVNSANAGDAGVAKGGLAPHGLVYRCTSVCQVRTHSPSAPPLFPHLRDPASFRAPLSPTAAVACSAQQHTTSSPQSSLNSQHRDLQVRSKPGYKQGSKVGDLRVGEECHVMELGSDGYLRISSLNTWREGLEPRGWVPVASMELSVQSSLEGKENGSSPAPGPKKRHKKSFVSPAKVVTQTPRPTADGSLEPQLAAAARASGAATPKLFDDCGRPITHPEHGVPAPVRSLSDDEVEVCFETRGSLGIAFCKQAGKIVVREVVAGGVADTMRRTASASSSVSMAHGLRPGMVLRTVQGQPVSSLGFAASMALLSAAPRPLSLEFEKELVKPLTPTKATGRSVTAACDAFFVSGMHTQKNAAVAMTKLAREYVANGAKLLLSAENIADDVAVPTQLQQSDLADKVESVREAQLHFISALRLAPANHAALTLLTKAEMFLSDLTARVGAAEDGMKRTGSGGLKRTTSDAGLTGANNTDTIDMSVTGELSMMLAAPDQPDGAGEPDSIKELLAQLKALDQHDSASVDESANGSPTCTAAAAAPEVNVSMPMAQLLLDLQVLELEDELELLSGGTLPTPKSVVATPASARRSSSNSSVLCTPTVPEPTTEADSMPIDAMDFTSMMASWRLSNSPSAQQQNQAAAEDSSQDDALACESECDPCSPAASEASRISRSASPSAMIEQDILAFEEQLDCVAAARSPQSAACSPLPAPSAASTCSPPAIVEQSVSHDDVEEELIGFCHTAGSPVAATADSSMAQAVSDMDEVQAPQLQQQQHQHLCSPSDSLVSPITAMLHKGRAASVTLTAQRRLEMKSQRDMIVVADDIVEQEQSILNLCNELRTASSEEETEEQPGVRNLTHANMPPLPVVQQTVMAPVVSASPIAAMAVEHSYSPPPVATAVVSGSGGGSSGGGVTVPQLAGRFSAASTASFAAPAADVRSADSGPGGGIDCLEDVAEATRSSRNFWLEKEREMKRTQLLQRLSTAVIAASSICGSEGDGEASEQVVV